MRSAACFTRSFNSALSSSCWVEVRIVNLCVVSPETHRRELAGYKSENHGFVPRKMFERLECSCPFRVVFQVVAINIDVIEELNGDSVISTLAKVHSVLRANRLDPITMGSTHSAKP